MLRLRHAATALVFAAAVAACGAAAAPAPTAAPTAGPTAAPTATTALVATPAPSGPLVTVVLRGGHCAAATCEQTVTIEQGGRVHIAAKPPNELGIVGVVDLLALQSAIVGTDFTALRTHRFTGECPVNYDGQEMVITFATPKGDEQLAACETQLDPTWPVLAALAKALEPIWPLPEPPK